MTSKKTDRTRRRLLKYSAGLFAMGMVRTEAVTWTGTRDVPGDDLINLSAVEAVDKMKSGEMGAVTYAEALIERANQEKALNAFVNLDPEQVLKFARVADQRREKGEALGLLHGLPIPVKDSVFTVDYPTTAGTAALRQFNHRMDGSLIKRLKDAGAIVMGKTNLEELSTGHTSNNEIFGAVHNPYDPSLIPGGSSGGTAVAVAAGMAPIGIAEDTFGSIRVPASFCGVTGFRPTTGRYPNDGVMPLTPRFDQLGPIARNVADIILFDKVITGSTSRYTQTSLDTIRIGVPRSYFYEGMASETRAVINNALQRLDEAGVTLVEEDISNVKELIEQSYFTVLNYEVFEHLDGFFRGLGISGGLSEVLEQAGPRMRTLYTDNLIPHAPNAVSEEAYQNALQTLKQLQEATWNYFTHHKLNAIVFPSTLSTAFPIGAIEVTVDGVTVPPIAITGNNQSLAPACSLPALTLPAGLTKSGLPVGIEFTAPQKNDEKLLALGLSLEKVLGPFSKSVLTR